MDVGMTMVPYRNDNGQGIIVLFLYLALTSIPNLALSHNYFVQFNSITCQISQNITKVMIGTTKMSKGLYIIELHLINILLSFVIVVLILTLLYGSIDYAIYI